eukprot:m51a1_g11935 hypothetical protein (560) ;mRNA; f:712073-714211
MSLRLSLAARLKELVAKANGASPEALPAVLLSLDDIYSDANTAGREATDRVLKLSWDYGVPSLLLRGLSAGRAGPRRASGWCDVAGGLCMILQEVCVHPTAGSRVPQDDGLTAVAADTCCALCSIRGVARSLVPMLGDVSCALEASRSEDALLGLLDYVRRSCYADPLVAGVAVSEGVVSAACARVLSRDSTAAVVAASVAALVSMCDAAPQAADAFRENAAVVRKLSELVGTVDGAQQLVALVPVRETRSATLRDEPATKKKKRMGRQRAAAVIQSAWRGYVDRKLWARKRQAASVIGRFGRHALLVISLRRIAQIAREGRKEKSVQKYRRSTLAMREREKQIIAEMPAAAVPMYLEIRRGQAAAKIQSAWRGVLARRLCAVLRVQQRQEAAVRRIQRAWRAFLRRRVLRGALGKAAAAARAAADPAVLAAGVDSARLAALQRKVVAAYEARRAARVGDDRWSVLQREYGRAVAGAGPKDGEALKVAMRPRRSGQDLDDLRRRAHDMYARYIDARPRHILAAERMSLLVRDCKELVTDIASVRKLDDIATVRRLPPPA